MDDIVTSLSAASDRPPLVQAPCGPVAGFREGGMEAFLSIPYAESPTGPLRFLPPIPKTAWTLPFDATRIGPRAMQNPSMWGPAELDCSEDCLHLSVWTPASDNKRRPVVVQIHGGAHCEGFSIDPLHNGPHFVRDGEMVFVSINYRLGVFGFLDVSDLLGPDYAASGSNGLLDQIEALRWVRDNISAFGGDPERVILMGQSAGAKSVGALLLAPAARDLFHGAILQSGAVQCVRDKATALRVTDLFLDALTAEAPHLADTLQALQTFPADLLLRGQKRMEQSYAMYHLYSATVDGVALLEPADDALKAGRFAQVPLLLGVNRDELSMPLGPFDVTTVEMRLRQAFGDNAPHVHEAWRKLCRDMSPETAFGRIMTTYVYGNACLHLAHRVAAHGVPVWSYLWEVGLNGLAHHSSEMPYLFGYTEKDQQGGYNPALQDIADALHAAWTAFVQKGAPDAEGLPFWPPCTTGVSGYRMHLSVEPWVEQVSMNAYDTGFPSQAFRLS